MRQRSPGRPAGDSGRGRPVDGVVAGAAGVDGPGHREGSAVEGPPSRGRRAGTTQGQPPEKRGRPRSGGQPGPSTRQAPGGRSWCAGSLDPEGERAMQWWTFARSKATLRANLSVNSPMECITRGYRWGEAGRSARHAQIPRAGLAGTLRPVSPGHRVSPPDTAPVSAGDGPVSPDTKMAPRRRGAIGRESPRVTKREISYVAPGQARHDRSNQWTARAWVPDLLTVVVGLSSVDPLPCLLLRSGKGKS